MPDHERDLADDLDAFMAGDYLDLDDPAPTIEPPPDALRADAMLRARRSVMRRRAQIEEHAAMQIEWIEKWRADRTAGLVKRQADLERVLEQWFRAVNALDPRHKSESLTNGTVRLRAPVYSVEVIDEEALRAWLWANRPELLKIEVKPKVGDVKRAFVAGPVVSAGPDADWHAVLTGDGEQIPGVRLAKATQDTFSIGDR